MFTALTTGLCYAGVKFANFPHIILLVAPLGVALLGSAAIASQKVSTVVEWVAPAGIAAGSWLLLAPLLAL